MLSLEAVNNAARRHMAAGKGDVGTTTRALSRQAVYEIWMDGSTVKHIEERHGKMGKRTVQ